MRRHRTGQRASLLGISLLVLAGSASAQDVAPAAPSVTTSPLAEAAVSTTQKVELEGVDVTAKRQPVSIGPLPGLNLTKDQIPSGIQSATAAEIREVHSLNLSDFLNTQLQSINVNDYQGNPFQVDVTFRGFTAGPQLGTPQGLSVFFDGVRVNEPFGDIVNWDLIPLNALDRLDLFPGSNPVFGLNTLGGAISLRTKSGFTAPGVEIEGLGGSFGRRQVEASAGGSRGDLAGFAALHYFAEDGWRDNSPSRLWQGFARADYRLGFGTITGSALWSDNKLIGNGLIPIELYEQDHSAVYTSPDQTRNRLSQFNISGLFDVTDETNIATLIYRRDSRRKGINGDIYDGFDELFASDNFGNRTISNPNAEVCRYADTNGDGRPDEDENGNRLAPLNDPARQGLCENIDYTGTARNGAYGFNPVTGQFGEGPGFVDGTPIGVLTRTNIGQVTTGGSLQWNFNLERHKFLVGVAYDSSSADYNATQQLALIDASHRVYADPDNIDPVYRAAQIPITINAFSGTSRTASIFFSETWTARDNLFLTLSARYNINKVHNQVTARLGEDLTEIQNRYPTFILCPSNDLASCPDTVGPLVINDLGRERQDVSEEKFGFYSFNPSFGINWLPIKDLNLYANISRGARAPSVIELGCAYDGTPVVVRPGFIDPTTGIPVPDQTSPRSLVGPTCALPSALSGDPYLPQIRSLSGEVGARGVLFRNWEWNASAYRTDLKDDIYFAGASASRSYFDTVDKTRRQGFELGFKGKLDRFDLRAGYSYTAATFESEFYVLSPNNSSADFNINSQPGNVLSPTANANRGRGTYRDIRIDPGALLPGVPLHNLTAGIDYHVTKAFKVGLSAIAHSKSFVRGNENNAHQPNGTDQITDGFGPVDTIGTFNGGRPFTRGGTVPGYAVFNFDASLKLPRGFAVFARVTNLFDQEYFSAGRLGITPFAPSVNGAIGDSGYNYNSSEHQNTTFVGPGAPRAYFGGISYEFKPK